MFHLAVTFGTLMMAWLFIHTLFALYYAHGYYDANSNEHYPLDFPYENSPDYWNLMYFHWESVPAGRRLIFVLPAVSYAALRCFMVYCHSFLIPLCWRW